MDSETIFRFGAKGNFPFDFNIDVKGILYSVNRFLAISRSKIISDLVCQNPESSTVFIKLEDNFNEFYYIAELFRGRSINLSKSNIFFISMVAKSLEIEELIVKTNSFYKYLNKIEQLFSESIEYKQLLDLEKMVFSKYENKLVVMGENIGKFDPQIGKHSLFSLCLKEPLHYFEIKSSVDHVLQSLLVRMIKESKNIDFANEILYFNSLEHDENNITEDLMQKMTEIEKVLMNDNIVKLMEMASKVYFNYNNKIDSPIFSILNKSCLIETAAFFSAIQCFKFLMLNGSDLTPNISMFAVAGGSTEIIRICEQKGMKFEGTLEVAIQYHRDEVFNWIYLNKRSFTNLIKENLVCKCLDYSNFSCFKTLIEDGVNYNNKGFSLLSKAAQINNTLAFRFILEIPDIDVNGKGEDGLSAIHYVCISGNQDMFDIIIKHNVDFYERNKNHLKDQCNACERNFYFSLNIQDGYYGGGVFI